MALMEHLDRVPEPADMAGNNCDSNLAEVIPIDPSVTQEGLFNEPDKSGIMWMRETPFGLDDGPQDRLRRTGFIAVNGYLHLVRVSEAHPDFITPENPPKSKVIFHGLTEFADGGTAMSLHDQIALANPAERTISVATDGVSIHGESLSTKEALEKSIEEMAEERVEIISKLVGPEPVTLVGTSMGSIIATHVASHNLAREPAEQINIEELVFISPGVVACNVSQQERFRRMPENDITRHFILARFLAHMAIDPHREALSNPKEIFEASKGILGAVKAVAKEPRKGLAILGNFNAVRSGTPWEMLKEVAAIYPISVLTGAKDPLREEAQWRALQKLYPDNVTMTLIPKKGHCLSVNAKGTAAIV